MVFSKDKKMGKEDLLQVNDVILDHSTQSITNKIQTKTTDDNAIVDGDSVLKLCSLAEINE